MEGTGQKLVRELKAHILNVMGHIEDCMPDREGVIYREIQDLAGLGLELPAHDGWLTWSVLAALVQDGLVDATREGRRLRWRLSNTKTG